MMPVLTRIRDLEEGNLDEEDSLAFPHYDDWYQASNTKAEHDLEKLVADTQWPSCSTTDENIICLSRNNLTESNFPHPYQNELERQQLLNTRLLNAVGQRDFEEMQNLLYKGANPNATCHKGNVSACHIAALVGDHALSMLVDHNVEKCRMDDQGRTPLHLAAWAGNIRQIEILLDVPLDVIKEKRDTFDDDKLLSRHVKKYCENNKGLVDTYLRKSERKTLPATWMDHVDHDCWKMKWRNNNAELVGSMLNNFSPLHLAAARIQVHATNLLLAAGVDPNMCDEMGRTVLDVVAIASNGTMLMERFSEVIRMILIAGGQHNTMKDGGVNNVSTPLHTAVKFGNKDTLEKLLAYGASVNCWDESGQTPLHACVKERCYDILKVLVEKQPDVKDKQGNTVLRAAIDSYWKSGVQIALNAGADVTLKANDGQTCLHAAAMQHSHCEVLRTILSLTNKKNVVNCINKYGNTALFSAVKGGCYNHVKMLLDHGASIRHTNYNNLSVFHVAAKGGHKNVLSFLLDFDKKSTELMINKLTTPELEGFGPIHFAVTHNNFSCLEILKTRNADVCLRTTNIPHGSKTPLHIAAVDNNVEIAEYLILSDSPSKSLSVALAPRPIEQVDGNGWLPIHTAIINGSKDVVKLFLINGSNLVAQVSKDFCDSEKSTNVLDLIINNISKPTEFLEDVLDSCVSLDDSKKIFKIDYRILMPCQRLRKMDVIEALLKTGNNFEQKNLLQHPLIESFIYIKWRAVMLYYFIIAAIHTMFMVSITAFATSVFHNRDTYGIKPEWSNLWTGECVIFSLIILILLLELLMNFKSRRYFLKPEKVVKLTSLGLAIVLPSAVTVQEGAEWPRQVATGALLLAWIQMLIIISQFPSWGYNVVMFWNVASNVIKILGTFVCLIIGFAFSFMILFHSQTPFNGPWDAFVKTLFLLTAEFDFDNLFNAQNAKDLGSSFHVVRLIFVAFLVLATVVLMNMMVGVAVDDMDDLKFCANIGSLEKQVAFVGSLDTLECNLRKILSCMPDGYYKQLLLQFLERNTVKLVLNYDIRDMPKRFRDAFFNIAQRNQEKDKQKTRENKMELGDGNLKKKCVNCDLTNKKLLALKEVIKDLNLKMNRLIKSEDNFDDISEDFSSTEDMFENENPAFRSGPGGTLLEIDDELTN